MSPLDRQRARVNAAVAAAALLAVGAVVGVTLLQTRGSQTTQPGAVSKPRAGIPLLLFDYGVRDDAETRDLARGAALLKHGKRAEAEAVFSRYHSVQAQIGEAFARWPDLDAVKEIAAHYPDSAVAQLHLGLALLWAGRNADAVKQLEEVDSRFPDSPSSVDAEDVLFAGRYVPGLPYIVVPVTLPNASTLAQQLARARRLRGADGKLAYGVMLWRLDRRVSARREFDAAARLAPNDPAILTAAAVSRFTKRNPTAAFARLGPLSGRFPKAAVVRLHLGLLLIWTKQVEKGARQLRLAADEQPGSVYADEAKKLLSALVANGTK
jgi:tetratricopeptide (TPR) repeat protein